MTGIIMVTFLGNALSQQPFRTAIKVNIKDDPAAAKKIQTNVSQFFYAISRAFYSTNKKITYATVSISPEARKNLDTIFKSNSFRCKVDTLVCEGLMLADGRGYELRNIPIIDLKNAVHQIILDFDNSGAVTDMLFSNDALIYKISNITAQIDNDRLSIIKTFMENFRTAYNRKDTSYLRLMFSNDALIITGKVLTSMNKPTFELPPSIVYKVQTKEEYFKSLAMVFKRNEYINIKFDSIMIVKHDTYNDYYGVSVKQFWNSSYYNDIGYVFLLIQFRNQTDVNPIIHLRAWQPVNRFGIYSVDIEPKDRY
ncbi:MAG: hypothetical protein WCK34_00785 [Bacteroidota bacterium]